MDFGQTQLNNLQTQLQQLQQIMNRPAPGIPQAYDIIHEWQVAHAAEVRSLIQLARE